MQTLYLLFLLLLLILVLLLLVPLFFHLILLTNKAQQTSSQRTRKMCRVSLARTLVYKFVTRPTRAESGEKSGARSNLVR